MASPLGRGLRRHASHPYHPPRWRHDDQGRQSKYPERPVEQPRPLPRQYRPERFGHDRGNRQQRHGYGGRDHVQVQRQLISLHILRKNHMHTIHERLCRVSGLYRRWPAHPHHRHHHWLAVSLACVLGAYAVVGAWGASEGEQDLLAAQLLLGISVARAQTICQSPEKFSGSDTNKVQSAIDTCSSGDGGIVRLDRNYATDTIELKSNVTFDLNNKILSTRSGGTFTSFKCDGCSTTFFGTDNGASNVKLIGPGTIARTVPNIGHLVEFFDATDVEVRDITVDSMNAPTHDNGFHFVVSNSQTVRVYDIKVNGRRDGDWGNDGVDIREGSRDVKVIGTKSGGCVINTHDDGLVVATSADPNNPSLALDDVTFENCDVTSDSASIKFGTGTTNPIRNIVYNNIRVHGPKGIRIDNLDGSIIENVTLSNITFEDSVDQMFLCGGGSLPTKECRGDREGGTPRGTIQNICYTDITVKGGATTVDPGQYGESSINGMRNITLRNINFESGAGSPPLAKFRDISGLAFENITYSGKRYDDPRSLFEIQGSVSGITPNGNPYGCQPGSPPADTGDDLPPPACTPGQSCTTSQSCPGTIECEGNQPFCTDTPGDNCPAGGPGAGSGQVAANLDCDTDNNVDVFDLALLMYFWDATPPFTTACGKNADFDGNASVDFRDFPHLRNCWGRPSPCTGAGGGGNGGGGGDDDGGGTNPPIPPPPDYDPKQGHTYPRTAVWQFGGAIPDWYARFDLVMSAEFNRDFISQTRQLNPNIIYLPTRDFNGGCDFMSCPEEWDLHYSDGSRIPLYDLDN